MPRIRSIKPEFWADEKLSQLEPITRLVFVGLISMADDAGRLLDNVKALDGQLFPSTDHSSRESLDTLASLSRITRYTSASGQRIIQITGWAKHQKVDKPSAYTLPAPPLSNGHPNDSRESLDTLASDARKSRENVARLSRSDLGSRTLDLGSLTTTHTQQNASPNELNSSSTRNLESAFASATDSLSNSESNLGQRLGPNERDSLAAFLAALGKGQSPSEWVIRINSLLDNGHSAEHVSAALRDWPSAGYPLTPSNFFAFVRRAEKDSRTNNKRPNEPRSSSSTGSRARQPGNAPSGDDGLTTFQRDVQRAAELVNARRAKTDGDDWWRYAEQSAAALGKVKRGDVLLHAATLIYQTPPVEGDP